MDLNVQDGQEPREPARPVALIGRWAAPFGQAVLSMVLAADGSADFNGIPGMWGYAEGELTIAAAGGVVHRFAATVADDALSVTAAGLPHPLVFARSPPADGAATAHQGASAATEGLVGVWEDADGGQITLSGDGIALMLGTVMRYQVYELNIAFSGDGADWRLPYTLRDGVLTMVTGASRLELRRQGAARPLSPEKTTPQARMGEPPPDAKEDIDIDAFAAMLAGLSGEQRRQAQIVGLIRYGYRFNKLLYDLARQAKNGPIQQQFAETTQLLLAWLGGARLTDRADEDERRAQAAKELLQHADPAAGPYLNRVAARAILALPKGHPLRDENGARLALADLADRCEKDEQWDSWLLTVQTLVEYALVPSERLPSVVAAAELLLPKHADLRDRFRITVLSAYAREAIVARDAGHDAAFQEWLSRAMTQKERVTAGGGDAALRGLDLKYLGLLQHLSGQTAEAVATYARALASGDLDADDARLIALKEGALRLAAGEHSRVIDVLSPIVPALQDEYLMAISDAAVASTGKSFSEGVTNLAFSLASVGRWGEALSMLDRSKSLRLRHRAALRESAAGKDLLVLERALYAESRGATAELPRGSAEQDDPLGGTLSLGVRYSEAYRQARPQGSADRVVSPSVAEIAASLHPDEAAVVFGVHTDGTLVMVVFPGDVDAPGAHRILLDWPAARLAQEQHDVRRRWLYVLAAPAGYAQCSPREAIGELIPHFEEALGAPLVEMLNGRDVHRLILIPHVFLHLVPFWVLPSLSRYTLELASSAEELVRRRQSRARAARTALAVVDPTLDLPLSPAEADAMDGRLGGAGWSVARLARREAREGRVIDALGGVSVLHVSGHGRSDSIVPTKSALLLYPELGRFSALLPDPLASLARSVTRWSVDPWGGESAFFPGLGRLDQMRYEKVGATERSLEYSETGTLWQRYAGDVLTHQAELWRAGDMMVADTLKDCALAFLSACSAGRVRNEGSGVDESAGLPAAMQLAGVGAVVASLWPVEDGVTALYVDLFYAALADAVQPTDLATLVRDTAETLRAMGRETAVERLTDLRRRTKDPNARFRLEAAAHRAEQGAEQPFQHPCDWGAFYLTGRSEIDFSLSREATDAKS